MNIKIYIISLISNLRLSNSKTMLESHNISSSNMSPHGDDEAALLLNPLITTAITLNDVSLSNYQNIVISITINVIPSNSEFIAYSKNTSL